MGLLDRYNFGRTPFAPELGPIDPRTGLPVGQPPAQPQRPAQAQPDMPWGANGQAFADMYSPRPNPPVAAPRPAQMPAIRPMGPPNIPMPQQSAASPPHQPVGASFDMTSPDASWAAYDPAMGAYPGVPIQPQPGDVATGVNQPKKSGDLFSAAGDFITDITSDREDGFNRTDLLQLGLSLLGNAENGAGWSGVAEDFGGIQQGVERRQDRALSKEDREREIKRQEEADARTKEEFGAWRKEQERVAGLTTRYEEALKDPSLDPEAKRMLGIMGPEGFGQFEMWRAEKEARSDERKADQVFTAGENAKNRAASAAEARIRSANENSIGRYFQAQDAQTIGESNSSAAQLQSRGLPMLQAVKGDLNKARELGLQRGFFDANSKIKLGQVFNENGPMQTTLETWRARVMGPALETLKGLGAMSEREMIAAMESFANPDMTLDAASELLDERIRLAENKLLENKTMNEFFTDAKGLTGKRNAAGQDWNTALTLALENDRKARAGTAEAAKAAEPAPAVPKVGEIRDGYRFVGGDPSAATSWQAVRKPPEPSATPFKNGFQSIRGG